MGKTSTSQPPMWPWAAKKPAATAPSVHGILKARDSHHLFTQLSDGRPLHEAFSSSKNISRSHIGSRRRRQSRKIESEDLSADRRQSFPRKGSRSRERPFRSLRPFGTAALDAIPVDNLSDDIRDVVLVNGQPSIPISPEELVALSFVLGVPLTIDSHDEKITPRIHGSGAFGMSLRSEISSNNIHQIRLQYSAPNVIQQPASGGSYSILFAKHMACGSIPFADDQYTTHTLFIDADALSVLKQGQNTIGLATSKSTYQKDYLSSLPSRSTITFHSIMPDTTHRPRPNPHRSKSVTIAASAIPNTSSPRRTWSTRRVRNDDASTNPNANASRRVSWGGFHRHSSSSSPTPSSTPNPLTFPALMSSLPFTGGLTPLASAPLLNAVRFTASAGRRLGNLLPLLENLVHKIHLHAPHVDFGPYLRAENHVEWLRTAGYVDYTPTPYETDVATGVGRVSRYVAAVSALVAMLKTTESVDAARRETWVEDACRSEMEGAYWDAVRGGADKGEARDTLGAQLAEILKKPLPFDVETVATVARLVVAAWTWQAGVVVWNESEREEVRRWKGDRGVYEAWALERLPVGLVLA